MVAFWCYNLGVVGIDRWYDGLPTDVRAEVDAALELIQATTIEDAEDAEDLKPLRGRCGGLTEVKIEFVLNGQQYHLRILGVYGPGRSDFTLLWPFFKHGGPDYGPACRSANTRKRGLEKHDDRR